MNEVTRILTAIDQGDPHAAEQLLPLVYEELRKLAAQRLGQEKPGEMLQATALVHEAYLRLVGPKPSQVFKTSEVWNSRGHFFAAAAEAMRSPTQQIAKIFQNHLAVLWFYDLMAFSPPHLAGARQSQHGREHRTQARRFLRTFFLLEGTRP